MFSNDQKLYYLQQLGITCWVKREPRIENMLFCQIASNRDYPQNKIMIIGETSECNEANFTRPFAGKVDELFDKMLASIDLVAHNVDITNTLPCRKFAGRELEVADLEAYRSFFMQQIKLFAPQLILAFGLHVGQLLYGSCVPLEDMRSIDHSYANIPFVVTYTPEFLLNNPQYKKRAYQDLLLVKQKNVHYFEHADLVGRFDKNPV